VEIELAGWADLREPDETGNRAELPLRVLVTRSRDGRVELDVPTELLEEAEVVFAPIPVASIGHAPWAFVPYPLELLQAAEQPALTRMDLDHAMDLLGWMREHCTDKAVATVNGPQVRARVVNGRLTVKESTEAPGDLDYALIPLDWDEMDDAERAALHQELEASLREAEAGELIPASIVMEELRARRK
jgi:hypothetical protein